MIRPDPKPTRARLKGADYTRFRREVYMRANGCCETCGRFALLNINGMFIPALCGHVSHKRHGSNKEDKLESVIWECPKCHGKRNETK